MSAVHGLTMEQRCTQLNIPMENCAHRRNLDLLLSSANYPVLRDRKCDKGGCMAYLYKDECDICDSQECFRMCQGKKGNDKEFLEFIRSIAERSRISAKYEILDSLRHGTGDVKTVTVMDSPPERENVKVVTVSQNEQPSVVTVTQNEIKTVTVEPSSKHETRGSEKTRQEACTDNCEWKSHGHSRRSGGARDRREIASDDSDSVLPTICVDRNGCDTTKPRFDKEASKKGYEPRRGGSSDVTVTRVVEKTTTLEKPLTLYREVTTTITKEKPIINYKVTTFTDTSTRVESVVVTKTETQMLTVGGGAQYYQSVSGSGNQLTEPILPEYGVNKTVRIPSNDLIGQIQGMGGSIVTVTRCDKDATAQSKAANYLPRRGIVTITKCDTDVPAQPKAVVSPTHQSTVTVTRGDVPSYVKVVTVTKSPDNAASNFENVITTTVLGPAISVITVNVPTVSTITTQPVSLITTVITISPDTGAILPTAPRATAKDPTKTASRAVSKGCEILPHARKPRTICRFQNVPKEFLKRVMGREKDRTKRRRTVYRTVYSTEGSGGECEKVVTTTVLV